MSKYTYEWEPGGLLHLRLFEHLALAEAHELIATVKRELDEHAPPLRLLIDRVRPAWIPIEAQIDAGQMLRHPHLKRIAICGPSISGGAASNLIGKISHKGMHFCETVEQARTFLLAPDAPAVEDSLPLEDL